MPRAAIDKVKLQQLARWLLPQYLETQEGILEDLAYSYGLRLIDRLPGSELRAWVTEMQLSLAGIEETKE